MTASTAMQLGVFALHTTFFCSPHIGTYVVRYICADRLLRTEPQVRLRCIHNKQLFEQPHVASSESASERVMNE